MHASGTLRLIAAAVGLLGMLSMLREAVPAAAEPVYENPRQKDPVLELARLRNEGLAHFESGIGLKKALAAFEAALQLQPGSPTELFNLGTVQRKLGDSAKALELLERAAAADPKLAHVPYTRGLVQRARGDSAAALKAFEAARLLAPQEASVHYQLGRLYRESKEEPKALQSFIDALQLDPQHTGTMYQLFLYYQEHGEADRAKALFQEFSRVKRALSRTRKELNDDESWLAKPIVAATPARPEPRGPKAAWRAVALVSTKQVTAFAVRDIDRDGRDEILAGNRDGTIAVYRDSGQLKFEQAAAIDLGTRQPVTTLNAAILVRNETQRLIASTAAGVFVAKQDLRHAQPGFVQLSTTPARQIHRADLDHDGDVDLFSEALGEIWLNDGAAGFTRADYLDADSRKALAKLDGPVVGLDALGRNGIDLVVHGGAGKRVLLADALGGRHVARPFPALAGVSAITTADAVDLDNDGGLDLVTGSREGVHVAYHESGYTFATAARVAQDTDTQAALALGDFDNDGWKDLLELGAAHAVWRRNVGARKFQSHSTPLKLGAAPGAAPVVTDLDRDGRLDAVALLASGDIVLLKNEMDGAGAMMRVWLDGQRSAPSGLHTIVELRRGNLYQKYVSAGNALDLPLGKENYAEIVRIQWPNGFVESKLRVEAGKLWHFKESERVSGSCPSVFAWDGGRFRFITDAFISGPMGVPYGRGYFPVDHDEYLKIPGEALAAVDDKLRIAITEELREAVFLDRVRLLAVDHPADTELYPNEFLRAGDFPQFKVHLTRDARPPEVAVDHRGRDVRDAVSAADRRYPSGFRRLQYEGLAEENAIEIELPPGAAQAPALRLFLTGWFHYFESTSLQAVSQRADLRPQWPQVEVLDQGRWRQVVEIGIPSGKDKTVVVDLTHRLPPDARRLRIRTNLALYWDRIAIDTSEPPRQANLAAAELTSAKLRFKGFSAFEPVASSAQPQPERFVYSAMRFHAPWNPLAGRYTRYGAVDELLTGIDSLMAVFGSGDELQLEFDASELPAVPRGWRRDYLLYLNGYVKDGDKYTANAGRLEPIPYAGMTSYPYDPQDPPAAVFATPAYRDYLARYQTRHPLRFTGPVLAPTPDSSAAAAVLSRADPLVEERP